MNVKKSRGIVEGLEDGIEGKLGVKQEKAWAFQKEIRVRPNAEMCELDSVSPNVLIWGSRRSMWRYKDWSTVNAN